MERQNLGGGISKKEVEVAPDPTVSFKSRIQQLRDALEQQQLLKKESPELFHTYREWSDEVDLDAVKNIFSEYAEKSGCKVEKNEFCTQRRHLHNRKR